MSWLRQTRLEIKDILVSLTDGLPVNYRDYVATARPTTYEEWLRTAIAVEDAMESDPLRKNRHESRNSNVVNNKTEAHPAN